MFEPKPPHVNNTSFAIGCDIDIFHSGLFIASGIIYVRACSQIQFAHAADFDQGTLQWVQE